MGKLPAFQFYPSDWLSDNVAGCSLAAQGLWLRMMIVMHNSNPYGHLAQDGKALLPETAYRRCGASSLDEYLTLLEELDRAGVPSRNRAGIIYSRRMIRDEEERAKNRGYQATHRKLLRTKENSKENVRPLSGASSTSSSSSKNKHPPPTGSPPAAQASDLPVLPAWLARESWAGFVEMRRKIRAPLTGRAAKGILDKLAEMRARGRDPNACLDQSTERAWRGVFEVHRNGGTNGRANGNYRTKADQTLHAGRELIAELAGSGVDPDGDTEECGGDEGGAAPVLEGTPSLRRR